MKFEDYKPDPRRLHHHEIDADVCMGCKKCLKICDYDVYQWSKEGKHPVASYSEDCAACLQCMYFCPSGAIKVIQSELAFYDPLYDPLGLNN